MNASAPLVAVVGRPNVGKSTLVNRLIGRREAIVEETSGVTRDTKSFTAQWRERAFAVVDTGGLAPHPDELGARIAEQAHKALAHADLILFVLDATTGAVEDDLRVAELLRQLDKPVLVVANKVDDVHQESLVPELYALGLGEVVPVSALHGRRSGDLLDAIVALLPADGPAGREEWASAAIVGRPNVGKSSLLNALLNETRAIVDPAPGTTRDPVDSYVEIGSGKTLRIVDTAGMRREVQIKDPLEYFSWLRSRATLARVDAALLVVDAADGVSSFDQRLGEEIASSGRACLLVFNKWDLMTGNEDARVSFEGDAKRRLRFLPWAPVVRTSAITGRGVAKVLPALDNAIASHRTRLTTSVVNRVIAGAQERQSPPRVRGRAVRILYGVQAAVAPPKFVMFATGPIEDGYVRYLERRLRAEFPFAGSPLAISVRTRDKVKV